MYVCMYVCTYVRMYVRTYVRMYVCMYCDEMQAMCTGWIWDDFLKFSIICGEAVEWNKIGKCVMVLTRHELIPMPTFAAAWVVKDDQYPRMLHNILWSYSAIKHSKAVASSTFFRKPQRAALTRLASLSQYWTQQPMSRFQVGLLGPRPPSHPHRWPNHPLISPDTGRLLALSLCYIRFIQGFPISFFCLKTIQKSGKHTTHSFSERTRTVWWCSKHHHSRPSLAAPSGPIPGWMGSEKKVGIVEFSLWKKLWFIMFIGKDYGMVYNGL